MCYWKIIRPWTPMFLEINPTLICVHFVKVMNNDGFKCADENLVCWLPDVIDAYFVEYFVKKSWEMQNKPLIQGRNYEPNKGTTSW